MAQRIRHAIGVILIFSFVFSFFLIHKAPVAGIETASSSVRLTPLESLGVLLLMVWIVLVLASGGILLREGRPARKMSALALLAYMAGIAVILRSMPAYHEISIMRYHGGILYLLALTPLASLLDVLLPFPQKRETLPDDEKPR